MTTFDLADVRRFTADLDARMDQCDTGEGMECANLDGTLRSMRFFAASSANKYANGAARFSADTRPLTRKWRNIGSTKALSFADAQANGGPRGRKCQVNASPCKTAPRLALLCYYLNGFCSPG